VRAALTTIGSMLPAKATVVAMLRP
jgi:hypothetical protein